MTNAARHLAILGGFQLVWLACALGAAQGLSWLGVAAALAYVPMVLRLSPNAGRLTLLLLIAGGAGIIIEGALIVTDLVRYQAPWPGPPLPPLWIITLWLAFGAALPTTAAMLGDRALAKASISGALLGPLAYRAGASLSALEVADPAWLGYVILALTWGVVLPGLVRLTIACEHGV